MNKDLDEFSDVGENIDTGKEAGIKFSSNQYEDDEFPP